MSVNPWFKFYGAEYLSDPKIDQLTPLERACWVTLLCLANVSGEDGIVHNLKVFTLLTKSGIYPLDSAGEQMGLKDDYNDTLGVLEHLESLEMVKRVDAFSYQIINWVKRQETALTAAERQAKYRENKKSNESVTERVTKVTLEENREEKNRINTSVAIAPQVLEVPEEEKSQRVSTKKYSNAKQVFALWGKYPKNWDLNTTQLRAAENLFEEQESLEEISEALRFAQEHKDDDFCPQISSPYDLDSKWKKLDTYYDKIHG